MKNLILLLFISTAIFSLSLIDDDYASRIKVFDEYPVPSDENMLFYIQKSYNTNTVVYAANIDADGKVNSIVTQLKVGSKNWFASKFS